MPYIGRDLNRGNYLKLDDISSSFDSSTTTFNLTVGGSAFTPGSAFSILVSVGGVIQEPESAYQVNNSEITFANAPTAQDSFFCIALGVSLGIGVPGNGTVNGPQLAKPFNYDGFFYLDDANNRVGINSSVPKVALDVNGNAKISGILTAGSYSGPISNPSGISTFYDVRVTNNLTVEGSTTTLDTDLTAVDRVEVDANSNSIVGVAITQSGTADIINLFDGNTEVLTVTDGGNIGLGLTNPTTKLQIASGHINLSAGYSIQWGDSHERIEQSNGKLEFFTNNGEKMTLSGGSLLLGATSTSNAEQFRIHTSDSGKAIIKLTNSTTGTGTGDGFEFGLNASEQIEFFNKENTDMFFGTNNTERLRIESNGRIAVGGFSGASNDLHIKTASSPSIRLEDTTNTCVLLSYAQDSNAHVGTYSNHDLIFDTNSTEKLRIDSDGDVIIGSGGSWQYKKPLNVQGSSGSIISLYNGDTTSYAADTYSAIELKILTGNTGNTFGALEIRGIKEEGTNGNNARALTFYTGANGGSNAERLRIHSHGQLELKVPDANDALKITPSGTHANAKINFNTPGNGAAVIKVQGTERLSLNKDGNITNTGIATSYVTTSFASNFAKLDLRGTNIGNSNHYILSYGEGHANDHQFHMVNTLGDIVFRTGTGSNTERLHITSGGIVDVTGKLRIDISSTGGVGSGTAEGIFLRNTNETDNNAVTIFGGADDYNTAASAINFINIDHSANYGAISFDTRGAGGYVERARIDNSGNMQVSAGQFTVGTTATTGLQFINDGTFGTLHSATLKLRTASAERLRIDTTGRIIVGGTSAGTYHQDGDNLNIYSTGNTGLTVFSGTSSLGSLFFADGNNDVHQQRRGAIQYNHDGNSLAFWTNASERLRITSGGALQFNSTAMQIHLNTSDGSDNGYLNIGAAGGANNQNRGAQAVFYGNEHSSYRGQLGLLAGNSGNAAGYIYFKTGGTERIRINTNGTTDFYGDSSGTEQVKIQSNGGGTGLFIANFQGVDAGDASSRLGVGKNDNALIFTNASGSQISNFAIGNTDAVPLVFSTNNTRRLHIRGDGRIIMGTGIPTYTNSVVHVEGSGINVESEYTFEDSTGSSPIFSLFGSNSHVRLDMGTLDVSPYAAYIQARYDNDPEQSGTSNSGLEPLMLNPRGGALMYNVHDSNASYNVGGGANSEYGGFVLRAGRANTATVNNTNTAIKIYPAEVRSVIVGEEDQGAKFGGIAWHGLDPHNGGWNAYGGHQCWMGMSYHSTPGQEFSNWQVQMNSNSTSGSYATNVAMQANPNGYVTKPSQPRAHVKISGSPSISSAKVTAWATPDYNLGDIWDATNSRFIAKIKGLYMIGGNFRIGAPGKIRVIRFNLHVYDTSNTLLRKYGGGTGGGNNYDGGSGGYDHPYVSFTNIIFLNKNEYVELHTSEVGVENTSYIQTNSNYDHSNMWCVLLQ